MKALHIAVVLSSYKFATLLICSSWTERKWNNSDGIKTGTNTKPECVIEDKSKNKKKSAKEERENKRPKKQKKNMAEMKW